MSSRSMGVMNEVFIRLTISCRISSPRCSCSRIDAAMLLASSYSFMKRTRSCAAEARLAAWSANRVK